MGYNQNLRAPESILKQSRLDYIKSLTNKREFESECSVIIPDLDRRWQERILTPFDLTPSETTVVNWRHYLHNYTPQLLVHAINRLAKRMALKQQDYEPVRDVSAYFKNIVQDLRKAYLRKHATEEVASTLTSVGEPVAFGIEDVIPVETAE